MKRVRRFQGENPFSLPSEMESANPRNKIQVRVHGLRKYRALKFRRETPNRNSSVRGVTPKRALPRSY